NMGSGMFRNNGNGTFTEVTDQLGLGSQNLGVATAAIGTDYNNDRAVDLLIADPGPTIFENPREGQFQPRKLWSSALPAPVVGITVLDFDHDGWMDIVFTHMGSPGVSLWRDHHGKSFEPVKLPETNWVRAFGIAALDYDNDGWV